MKITLRNIQEVEECHFHDFRLGDIVCDYFNHKVQLVLVGEKEEKWKLTANGVRYFSIGIFETWGEGYYISEVSTFIERLDEIVKLDKEQVIEETEFVFEMLLNSGDRILILSKELEWNQD